MTTPDGIATEDWAGIEALARAVVEASGEGSTIAYVEAVEELRERLRLLESRYGPLPSILATIADYTEDDDEAIHLLKNAYFIAEQRHDVQNMTYIASSIAQRYVEDLHDLLEGRSWANVLRQCLKSFPDASEFELLSELEARLNNVELSS